ncbi:unnamed protein product [Echinostoma caproni]|uniref:Transmembrane protein n=1 Tax=Echinostoma caproni TaxID=27848 RepID=A0A183AM27_9TREM|nr:unnamed protein product [Echinostoma caproni]
MQIPYYRFGMAVGIGEMSIVHPVLFALILLSDLLNSFRIVRASGRDDQWDALNRIPFVSIGSRRLSRISRADYDGRLRDSANKRLTGQICWTAEGGLERITLQFSDLSTKILRFELVATTN